MILLDTHVLVWRAADDSRVGKRATRKIDRALADGEVAVSAFSFWEIAVLVNAGRLRLRATPNDLRTAAMDAGVGEIPVDGRVAILSTRLHGMHGAPADRIIVATALELGATLATADRAILAMKSGPLRIDVST